MVIPTNISVLRWSNFLEKELFIKVYDSCKRGLSVSRVGSAADCSNETRAGSLKLE